MEVLVVKKFNLSIHSYFLAMRVTTTVGDPRVFVVRRFRPIGSSSSSASEPASSSLSASSVSGSSGSGSSSQSSSSGPASSSSSAFPDLFPAACDQELYSVASLSDLLFLPPFPIEDGLFRTDTIAVAFKSQAQMDTFLRTIIKDLRTNALLQQIPLIDFEIREFSETVVDDPNPNAPFIF